MNILIIKTNGQTSFMVNSKSLKYSKEYLIICTGDGAIIRIPIAEILELEVS